MNSKILKFAIRMEVELYENSRKGDWNTFKDEDEILKEFDHHYNKLKFALNNNDPMMIKEYIADCANNLLFLGNSRNLYE
jgi:hypothetical protein